ncbi:MAG: hypothetical protein H7343_03550 [Undibacterium sp.]|nr:hypothetical protein [Opitutaceae bacterium]
MLAEEAYAFRSSLNRRDRRRLEIAFDKLRDHPFSEPSFVGFDSNGEEQFHLFLNDYAIASHVDHAVRLVFIQPILPNP